MLKISKDKLDLLFKKISAKFPLFMPIKKAGEVNYGLWTETSVSDLDTLKTVKSPKDLFFPQSEELMKFRLKDKQISIEDTRKENGIFVVMGVKACDYKAFEVLDNVFLSEPVDTYYKEKRDNGIIITLGCQTAEESCFCSTFGIDATSPKGDITTYIVDGDLYWNANTDKGEDLTTYIGELLVETDDDKVVKQKASVKDLLSKLPLNNLDTSYFKDTELKDIFNSKEWNSLSESCLGCGTCTFVCPTCQCFDIRDFKTDNGVIRFRCWDSCMYQDFTQMAGGNNRTTQMQRYRQRFMHKLVYYPNEHDGLFSCVGCGRCVNKCPQRLNIVKVIKTLGGKNDVK